MHNLYAFVFTVQVFRFFLIPVLCIDNNVEIMIHISVYKSCFIDNLFKPIHYFILLQSAKAYFKLGKHAYKKMENTTRIQ